jgi:hypothetical protein
MKHPGFVEGVILALGASLSTSLLYSLLSPYLPTESLLRLLIAALALGYVLYLLRRSPIRLGQVVSLLLWLGSAALCWLMAPPLTLYLMVHIGLIWLIRSLYFYRSLIASLADLGLGALGLAATLWAIAQTSSLFLAIWCFFLVQALFVFIPKTLKQKSAPPPENPLRFEQARQRAERALRSLQSMQ